LSMTGVAEVDETFIVTLGVPTGAVLNPALGTRTDDPRQRIEARVSRLAPSIEWQRLARPG